MCHEIVRVFYLNYHFLLNKCKGNTGFAIFGNSQLKIEVSTETVKYCSF